MEMVAWQVCFGGRQPPLPYGGTSVVRFGFAMFVVFLKDRRSLFGSSGHVLGPHD